MGGWHRAWIGAAQDGPVPLELASTEQGDALDEHIGMVLARAGLAEQPSLPSPEQQGSRAELGKRRPRGLRPRGLRLLWQPRWDEAEDRGEAEH